MAPRPPEAKRGLLLDEFQRHTITFTHRQILLALGFSSDEGRRQGPDSARMIGSILGVGINLTALYQFKARFFCRGYHHRLFHIAAAVLQFVSATFRQTMIH